jgi:HEPN domain-containing protein
MLDAGRHLYVVFCCQQAVEKALKALICERSGRMPPKLHNLSRLLKEVGLQVDADRAELLRLLTNLYVLTRYPGPPGGADGPLSNDEVAGLLARTEEMCQWILGKLK